MALIPMNVEQLRREGIKNNQKKRNAEKAFEAQVQALSRHSVGGLYDIREIKKSKQFKEQKNFYDADQADRKSVV